MSDVIIAALTTSDAEVFLAALTALGTIGAVVVALFGSRFGRPSLSMLPFDSESADGAVIHDNDGRPSAWIRLRVVNKRGRRTARAASVEIMDLVPLAPMSERLARLNAAHHPPLAPNHEKLLVGYALKWAERPTHELDIPGGGARRVDLVYLHSEDESRHLRIAVFEHERWDIDQGKISHRAHRPDDRHFLYRPAYAIGLAVHSSDAEPAFYTAEIRWDEVWPEDPTDVWKHITVTNLSESNDWPPVGWPPAASPSTS